MYIPDTQWINFSYYVVAVNLGDMVNKQKTLSFNMGDGSRKMYFLKED